MNDTTADEWDAYVAGHPHGHHEQSSRYGSNRTGFGLVCDRLEVREGGRIIGGCQVLAQRSPVGTYAVVLRPPLAATDDAALLDRVICELDELAVRRGYASVRIETFPTQDAVRAALARGGFASSADWFGERPSLVLPLAYSDADLLARMKPKGRYNLKLAERSGITVHLGDAASLDDFFSVHQATAAHQGFPTFPREYFSHVWRLFGSIERAVLFLARHDGKVVSAIFNSVCGRRMYYGWGGMNRDPAIRKLMPNYLLHFTAMRWARDHGCTHYDLVGVTDFKEKLSREEIQWPQPQRKYYGPLSVAREALAGLTWRNSTLRTGVNKVARRLGMRRPMPF